MTNANEIKHTQIWFETEKTAQKRVEQAQSIKERARKGGLRFESYLTPDFAVWIKILQEHNKEIE